METVNLHNYQFRKLREYKLDKNVTNTECQLYILNKKTKWYKYKELIKKFYITEGEYFSNKLYTINSLIDAKNNININSLVFPDSLISIDGKIVGYTMPFIEHNINLGSILNNPDVAFSIKRKALKSVGNILESISNVNNFYLSDIHESNFIFDYDTNDLKAVDIDSAKIGNNAPSVSKFMTYNDKLWDYNHKYPMNKEDIHIPNNNASNLCYIYMILNTISETHIYNKSIAEYYDYLEFLRDSGFNKELVDIFSYIYMYKDNVSPLPLLDSIPDDISGVNYKCFKKNIKY